MKETNNIVFIENFKGIIADTYNADARTALYTITPIYNPQKTETGEDSSFRLIMLSDSNIGGRRLTFDEAVSILTSFSPHFPTKIAVSRIEDSTELMFELKCSTRVRKPSEIANIEAEFAPFCVKIED